MPNQVLAVSGPELDEHTCAALAERGIDVRYVDVSGRDWSLLDGASFYALGGAETIREEEAAVLPESVEMVCFLGTGYRDYMDAQALTRRGIVACYTPKANAGAVAEFSVALLLAGLRRLLEGVGNIQAGMWDPLFGRSLSDCTVGIVGFGAVGERVAGILHSGFGARPLIWSRSDRRNAILTAGGEPCSLERLVKESDAILLAAGLAESGEALITKEELDVAKRTICIVNTARAGLIAADDLVEFLKARPDASYLSDVYYSEPVDPDHDNWGLLGLPNFYLTPHMAYASKSSFVEMGDMLLANIIAHQDGKDPLYCAI